MEVREPVEWDSSFRVAEKSWMCDEKCKICLDAVDAALKQQVTVVESNRKKDLDEIQNSHRKGEEVEEQDTGKSGVVIIQTPHKRG